MSDYNEFDIEIIPESFNLKEHDVDENTIFLTLKGTTTNKTNKMASYKSLSMDSVHCNGNGKRSLTSSYEDNETEQLIKNNKSKMNRNEKEHHMGDHRNGAEWQEKSLSSKRNYTKYERGMTKVMNSILADEHTRLVTKKIMDRYDKEQANRIGPGRLDNGRNIALPGIILHHPPPRSTDWQRTTWSKGKESVATNRNSDSNIAIDFDDSNYKTHSDYLKNRHKEIRLNAKGKQQGDGIKHQSIPLPPTIIKAKPKVVLETPKIEWQDRDTEFDDFFNEDDSWYHCQWQGQTEEVHSTWVEFLKKDVEVVIPKSVLIQNKKIQEERRQEKQRARLLRKMIREDKHRLKDLERKKAQLAKEHSYAIGVAQMVEDSEIPALSKKLDEAAVPFDTQKSRPLVLASEGKEANCYYRHVVSCEELGIGNLFCYLSKEITGSSEYSWRNVRWIRGSSFTETNLTSEEVSVARRSLNRTRLDVLEDFQSGEFKVVDNSSSGVYPPIVVEETSWYNKLIQKYQSAKSEISATVAKVRETATTMEKSTDKIKSVVKKCKFAVDALIDIRTIQLDIQCFFSSDEISFVDKIGRVYFYFNYIGKSYGGVVKAIASKTSDFSNTSQSIAETMCGFVKNLFNYFGLSDFCFKVFRDYNTLDTWFSKVTKWFPNIFKLIRYVVDWISMTFDTPRFLEWYDSVSGLGVENVVERVNNVMAMPLQEALDLHAGGELEKLYRDISDIVNIAGMGAWKNALFLKKKLEEFAKFQQKLIKLEEEAFGRITPLCICVEGESQIGKSQLLTALANELIPQDVSMDKRCYSRGPTEHYDGYNGHYCILVDDWAARVDTDYSELLQWVTCQTMLLPMASVDSSSVGLKGTTCQAKLVILATNTGYPQMGATMHNQKAVLKRRHVMIEAKKLKREYSADFSHLGFILKDSVVDKPILERMLTYKELVAYVKERNVRHLNTEKELLNARRRGVVGRAQYDSSVDILAGGMTTLSVLQSCYDVGNVVGHTLAGTTSYMSGLAKLCQVGVTGYRRIGVVLTPLLAIDAYFNDGSYVIPALIGAVTTVLAGVEMYMSTLPLIKEYDIRTTLAKVNMDKVDREWLYRMYEKRTYLRRSLKKYKEGQPGVNKEKLEKALRTMDMLQHWEEVELDIEVDYNEIEKLAEEDWFKNKEGMAESDMRTKDGIRKRKHFVAEMDYREEQDKTNWKFSYPPKDVEFKNRASAILYYPKYCKVWKVDLFLKYLAASKSSLRLFEILDICNGRNEIRKAKVEVIGISESVEALNLPKPTDDQVFNPRHLALNYIPFYVEYLKTTPRKDLLESANMAEWCARWMDASHRYSSLHQIIDCINNIGEAEASADRSSDDVSKLVLESMVKFKKIRGGTTVGSLNAICVKGSVFLLPYHFFLRNGGAEDSNFDIEISKGFEYSGSMYGSRSSLVIPFDVNNLCVSSHTYDRKDDWCLYYVGNSWPSGKDITAHFVKEADLGLLTNFDALLVLKSPEKIMHHVTGRTRAMTCYKAGDENARSFSLLRAWNYKANTENGDCGAPLIVRNAQLPRKILGIHVSAIRGTDEGFSSVITIEKIMEVMPSQAQWCEMPEIELEKLSKHITLDNFQYVGSVDKSRQVVEPKKTKIRESLVASLFEKKKFPSVLDCNDSRYKGEEDILEKQQDKYTGLRKEFENGLLTEIVQDLIDQHAFDPLYPRRVLDETEMLNGFDNLPRVDPHSSAGYPYGASWYKKEHGLPMLAGKETYLELSDHWTFRNDHMKSVVSYREEMAKKGKRVPSLWTATLKDETLGLAKVETGNTRLFQSPPMDFTLLLRKYTGAFSSFVFRNNLRLGTAAGFNPESGAWSLLAYELLGINRKVGALDYTWFDGSLSAQLIFGALQVINAWYNGSEEENLVRYVLFHEIVYTHILVRRDVYLKFKGNPSGNALTMVMNNLISKILLRYYWMRLAPINKRDCKIWSYTTKEFVMGDDNIFAIPEEYLEFLSGERIIAEAKVIGLTATSEKKDHTSVFKDIENTTFMQRGFRFEGLEIKPILNLKSIENMMIWITNSKFMTALECTQVNVECALRYLYFWGPYVYNHYVKILREFSNTEQLLLPLYSYEYYDRLYRETGELPSEYFM